MLLQKAESTKQLFPAQAHAVFLHLLELSFCSPFLFSFFPYHFSRIPACSRQGSRRLSSFNFFHFSLITFHFLLGSRVRLAPGNRDRRPQSSFSTQVLIGPARGLRSLSGFACTFFFLAWGIGAARFLLFCPSAIESVSASSHKIYPFTTCCQNVPLCQVSGHLRLFLYYYPGFTI